MPLSSESCIMVGGTTNSLIIIQKVAVSLPPLLAAVTTKQNVSATVGYPEICPAGERVNPGGKLPSSLHVMVGSPAEVVKVLLYDKPIVPVDIGSLRMVGAVIVSIVIHKVLVSKPAILVAVKRMQNTLCAVLTGVPEIIPVVVSKDNPLGKMPVVLHLIGLNPEASTVSL